MADVRIRVEEPPEGPAPVVAPPPEPAAPVVAAQELAASASALAVMILTVPFELIARRQGDHWRLTDAERDAIAPALSRVLGRMTLGLADRYPDAAVVVGGLVAAVGVRMAIDAAQPREEVTTNARAN